MPEQGWLRAAQQARRGCPNSYPGCNGPGTQIGNGVCASCDTPRDCGCATCRSSHG